MRIDIHIALSDLMFGIFWVSRRRQLYVMPFPCVGLVLTFVRPSFSRTVGL